MDDDEELIRPKDVLKYLNITHCTLYRWTNTGKINSVKTIGGKNRYYKHEILAFRNKNTGEPIPDERKKICYCRVSTSSQKDDLMRQIELFRSQFPNHTIITDIGSGLNFKRKGFQSILDDAIKGNIFEIVVTHKDRLCRFGFEVFERLLSAHKGSIVVLNQRTTSPQEELVNDLLSVITVFSARLYGLRSHSIKKKLKETILAEQTCPDTERTSPPNRHGEGTIEDNDGTISVVL